MGDPRLFAVATWLEATSIPEKGILTLLQFDTGLDNIKDDNMLLHGGKCPAGKGTIWVTTGGFATALFT